MWPASNSATLARFLAGPATWKLPWFADDAEPDADMWAAPGETREQIAELHRLSAAHSDATIDELALDAPGVVPWWPDERKHVTLHQILVHMCVETAHHLGHADILRELIDGRAGQRPGDPNLSSRTPEEWAVHRARIEAAAVAAEAGAGPAVSTRPVAGEWLRASPRNRDGGGETAAAAAAFDDDPGLPSVVLTECGSTWTHRSASAGALHGADPGQPV